MSHGSLYGSSRLIADFGDTTREKHVAPLHPTGGPTNSRPHYVQLGIHT